MTDGDFMAFQAAWKSLELQLIIRGSPTPLMIFTQATLGLCVEQNKTFVINGSAQKFDYAWRIGNGHGPIWACTNGDVIHEIPSDTPSAEYVYAASDIDVELLPRGFWPEEVSGRIHTPLAPNILALVQWFVASWAMNADQGAANGVQLPDLETLEAALGFFVNPQESNQGDSDDGSGNASSETSDHEHEFASTSYFRENLGGTTMEVLPKVEVLTFFPQDDETFHRISLNIGACADEAKGTVRGIYACVQHHSNFKNSPPMTIVLGPKIEALEDLGKRMSEEDPGLPLNLYDFFQRYKAKNIYLRWPFRFAQVDYKETGSNKVHFNELRALLKYCFILAAESQVYGYKNHRIPTNDDFDSQLQAVSDRIRWALAQGYSTAPGRNYIGKLQGRLQKLAAGHAGRTTRTAGNAKEDANRTGLRDLSDVPRATMYRLADDSNRDSQSVSEPPLSDLKQEGSGKVRSQTTPGRNSSLSARRQGGGQGPPPRTPLASSSRHNIPSSGRRAEHPKRRAEVSHARTSELTRASTARQQVNTGTNDLEFAGADSASSVDSDHASPTPSAPSRHLRNTAIPNPPQSIPALASDLKLRSHQDQFNLEANLQGEWQRLSDAKNALGEVQSSNFAEQVEVEQGLGKIDEQMVIIQDALKTIHNEKIKIRHIFYEKNKEKGDALGQQASKIEEALDLVEEARTPVEDLKMKIPPEDWDMDFEMTDRE